MLGHHSLALCGCSFRKVTWTAFTTSLKTFSIPSGCPAQLSTIWSISFYRSILDSRHITTAVQKYVNWLPVVWWIPDIFLFRSMKLVLEVIPSWKILRNTLLSATAAYLFRSLLIYVSVALLFSGFSSCRCNCRSYGVPFVFLVSLLFQGILVLLMCCALDALNFSGLDRNLQVSQLVQDEWHWTTTQSGTTDHWWSEIWQSDLVSSSSLKKRGAADEAPLLRKALYLQKGRRQLRAAVQAPYKATVNLSSFRIQGTTPSVWMGANKSLLLDQAVHNEYMLLFGGDSGKGETHRKQLYAFTRDIPCTDWPSAAMDFHQMNLKRSLNICAGETAK